MEVDTEATVYEPFEMYTKQKELKRDDCYCNMLIVVKKLIVMM